jgi:histidinol-phosphate aminotransferase
MIAANRYDPGLPAAVDLSDNTNAWGTPPAAQAALASATRGGVSRYPTAYGEPFKAAAARYIGVSTDQIITGCGSDDVLDVAIRSGATPGERLAFCAPTFAMIPFFGNLNRLENRPIPFRPDWEIDVDQLVSAEAAVTYICSPNNPTATGVSRQAIEAVVDRVRGLVIVDEAYAEYA